MLIVFFFIIHFPPLFFCTLFKTNKFQAGCKTFFTACLKNYTRKIYNFVNFIYTKIFALPGILPDCFYQLIPSLFMPFAYEFIKIGYGALPHDNLDKSILLQSTKSLRNFQI